MGKVRKFSAGEVTFNPDTTPNEFRSQLIRDVRPINELINIRNTLRGLIATIKNTDAYSSKTEKNKWNATIAALRLRTNIAMSCLNKLVPDAQNLAELEGNELAAMLEEWNEALKEPISDEVFDAGSEKPSA